MAKKNFKKYYPTDGIIDDNTWIEVAPKARRELLILFLIALGVTTFICYKWLNKSISIGLIIAFVLLVIYILLSKKMDKTFKHDMQEQLQNKIKTTTATFETFFTDTEAVTRLNPKNVVIRTTYDNIRTIFETKNYIICSLKNGNLMFCNKKQIDTEKQKELMKFVLDKIKYAEFDRFRSRF